MSRSILCFTAVCVLSLVAYSVSAVQPWHRAHLNAHNNAVLDRPSQPINFGDGPAGETPPLSLVGGAPFTVDDPLTFCPVHFDNGSQTYVRVTAIHAFSGNPQWDTVNLDEGISRSFGSVTAAVVGGRDNELFFASGSTVYRLDKLTGEIDWATPIDGTNSTPALSAYDFVNSSPQPGGDLVFIESYGGFVPANTQFLALNRETGAVEWFRNTQGTGTLTPPYVEIAGEGRVYTSAGLNNVICLDAADGTPVWQSDIDPPVTWSLSPFDIYGSMTYADGNLFVVGNSFTETTGTLVCADAATGELRWQSPAPVSDSPPLVIEDTVYVYGGGFAGDGNALLAAFDVADGQRLFLKDLGPFAFLFRNYMAATEDGIYVTMAGMLRVIDPGDGDVLQEASGDFSGPVTIDEKGGVYAHQSTFGGPSSLPVFGETVPVELGRFILD